NRTVESTGCWCVPHTACRATEVLHSAGWLLQLIDRMHGTARSSRQPHRSHRTPACALSATPLVSGPRQPRQFLPWHVFSSHDSGSALRADHRERHPRSPLSATAIFNRTRDRMSSIVALESVVWHLDQVENQ